MKKVIMGTLVMGVLLVSLASAGLVGFLSNVVSGTIEVEGPVFYLDDTNVIEGKEGSGFLRMNDDEVDGDVFALDSKRFYSDSLGVDSFYPMNFDISLDMNVSNLLRNDTSGELIETCSIGITVYKVGEFGGSSKRLIEICDIIQIGIAEGEYEDYIITCEGMSSDSVSFRETDRFEIFLTEQCSSGSTIDIKYGTSYMQVVAQ